MKLYPLLFKPNLHTVVWGGDRLPRYKGMTETVSGPIGESWEVSAVPSSPSIIANGPLAGRDLISVVEEYGSLLLGDGVYSRYGGRLPLLVKFIEAKTDLSIQVHPDDQLAMARHNKSGKAEMWYVIDAQPGAYLYAGFAKEISKREYRQRITDGTITDVLARHEVQAGDVFYIPAGRVHAICGGITLAEVQQSSDVTYRIYDYHRMGLDGKPRELHTALAVDAIDFHVEEDYRTCYDATQDRAVQIIDTPFFDVRIMELSEAKHRDLVKYGSFIISMCIKGGARIVVRDADSGVSEITLTEGNSCLIPASVADYDIIPDTPTTRILDAYIDCMDRSLASRITRFLHITGK